MCSVANGLGRGCLSGMGDGEAACTSSLPLGRYRILVNTNNLKYKEISINITVMIYAANVAA